MDAFDWTHKRVFVSGGAGVIGRPLIEKLTARGATLLVGDLKSRPETFSSDVNYRRGDLNKITPEELAAFAPHVFIHLAATFERSTETYAFYEENFAHNVRLSHHLMACVKDLPSLERVVFASSYLIYQPDLYLFDSPQSSPVSLSETDSIEPRNLTGSAKLNHEIELRFFNQFLQPRCSCVLARIFRGYGCGSRDVISRWVRALLDGQSIDVYNDAGQFDYIFGHDSAEGLIRIAETPHAGVVNLGSGISRRVSDIVDILQKHFPQASIKRTEDAGKIEASSANTDLLKKLTHGWVPETTLEAGIQQIIDYEKAHAGVTNPASAEGVLVTSISKKISLLRAVRGAMDACGLSGKLWGADLSVDALGRFAVDHFWKMPRLDSLSTDDLIAFCLKNDIRFIIPTRDGELEWFAQRREALQEHGIFVKVSPPESIRASVDKLAFAQAFAQKHPLIETAESPDDFSGSSYVVKERMGAGSRTIGLNLTRQDALDWAKTLEDPIFQPMVDGEEFSADVYCDGAGECRGVVLRTRDLVVNGESQVTTTFCDELIESQVRALIIDMNLRGHTVVQGIKTPSGCQIIEVNARFGGASSLSVACGLKSFEWWLRECAGEQITTPDAYPAGMRQLRMPMDSVQHADSEGVTIFS